MKDKTIDSPAEKGLVRSSINGDAIEYSHETFMSLWILKYLRKIATGKVPPNFISRGFVPDEELLKECLDTGKGDLLMGTRVLIRKEVNSEKFVEGFPELQATEEENNEKPVEDFSKLIGRLGELQKKE